MSNLIYSNFFFINLFYLELNSFDALILKTPKSNSSSHSIINKYIDEEILLRWEMESFNVGGSEWCLLEMKRIGLLNLCKDELKNNKPTRNKDTCCGILYKYNKATGDNYCSNCGFSKPIIKDDNDHFTFNDKKVYNQNCRHHYNFKEHFAQTLVDFANIGRRNVPEFVMDHFRKKIGRNKLITSMDIFKELQNKKWCRYYQYKYEIANRLRGKREINFSSKEIQILRDLFKRLNNEFIPYQELHDIGTKSKNGKRRLYWPQRFILKRLIKEIGRRDLIVYIRRIACNDRYKKYLSEWKKFNDYVDQRYPKYIHYTHKLYSVK